MSGETKTQPTQDGTSTPAESVPEKPRPKQPFVPGPVIFKPDEVWKVWVPSPPKDKE